MGRVGYRGSAGQKAVPCLSIFCTAWFKDAWCRDRHVVSIHPELASEELKTKYSAKLRPKKECKYCGKLIGTQHMAEHVRRKHAKNSLEK